MGMSPCSRLQWAGIVIGCFIEDYVRGGNGRNTPRMKSDGIEDPCAMHGPCVLANSLSTKFFKIICPERVSRLFRVLRCVE